MKLKTRWRNIGMCVYENVNGSRVHVGGRLVSVAGVSQNIYNPAIDRMININGGNVKRALMHYAEQSE